MSEIVDKKYFEIPPTRLAEHKAWPVRCKKCGTVFAPVQTSGVCPGCGNALRLKQTINRHAKQNKIV